MSLAAASGEVPLDAVIIGGGINGCAIAAEAAGRGLRVALLEQDDFGFGTTWRSTKLIHGGLRYLEHGDVRLVFESLRERTWLLKTRPYLVGRQRFVLPMLPWTRRPAWQLRSGLALYDMLALYRGVPAHRHWGLKRLRRAAPYLPDTASGAFTFYDARVHSPERLALELALDARRGGAVVANHARVSRIDVRRGHVVGVEVEHEGRVFSLPAHRVINAAGPWVDAVSALTEMPMPGLLGVTRGAHIALELDGDLPADAVFSTARSDGRVFFAVPQGGLLLVGTTDDRYEGDPSDVAPTREDVEYLLREAQVLLPGLGITRGEVRYAYAGLRPLQRVRGGPEAAITRRHAVIDHGQHGGPAGLLSVVGGKLSTFRPLARDVVNTIPSAGRSAGLDVPDPGPWRQSLEASALPAVALRHLRIYGHAIPHVLAGDRAVLCEHVPALRAEVAWAAEHEQAVTLSDILLRRTGIGWGSCRGLCCDTDAAAIAAPILGWSAIEQAAQVAAYRRDVARHLPQFTSLEGDARGQ